MYTAKELLDQLNSFDECNYLEAKSGTSVDRSIMETVCSFSNEPGLGGGYLLLGVQQDETELFPTYRPIILPDPDQIQRDLATRCATEFNTAIRPDIEVERVQGFTLLKIFVPELATAQKPLFFKNRRLPEGAYRRIGSTDQSCTEDDMGLFYNHTESFDNSPMANTSLDDIDLEAVDLYRKLRAEVNPSAEELTLDDKNLLLSLSCAVQDATAFRLTIAGVVLFGKSMAQRRLMPMLRTDYIRVPGNEWVSDPINRFTNVDMRGPMLRMVYRAISTVSDDLPKGFLLPEGEVQARHIGLPGRVLREVLVNAFMHQSYKVAQPLQIIRYSNRLEIINPGFSIKPEDQLGEPGSKPRNPYIAAVFHDTNLAETKGSGIRTMRRLMTDAELAPPTFESNHSANSFKARLLLHHFLSEEQLRWLSQFDVQGLNLDQKKALIFLRGVGAINNPIYRQIAGCDTLKASSDLRKLREIGLIEQKGKSTATYYVPTPALLSQSDENSLLDNRSTEPVPSLTEPVPSLIEPVPSLIEPVPSLTEPATALSNQLPDNLKTMLADIGPRSNNDADLRAVIVALCSWKPLNLNQLGALVSRSEKHLLYNYLIPLRTEGLLEFTIPEMPTHPQQAYKAPTQP